MGRGPDEAEVGRSWIGNCISPKAWMDDPERCRAAGIPAEREFATKAQIARGVPARLVDAGVPARWIAADEAYGQDYRFRRAIELLGESSWYPVRADASSNPDS